MADHSLDEDVKTEIGPVIDGKPTKISTFSAQQLKGSYLLPGIVEVINAAFYKAHSETLGIPHPDPRLSSPDDFIATLRGDAEAFAMILFQDQPDRRVLSTAVCRRYYGADKNVVSAWLFDHEPDAATEEWELKLLTAHPAVQGKGLASFMLKLAERKVIERFHERRKGRGNSTGEKRRMKMIFSTPKQLWLEYYLKRGYQEAYSKPRGDGHNFDVVFMSKVLATES